MFIFTSVPYPSSTLFKSLNIFLFYFFSNCAHLYSLMSNTVISLSHTLCLLFISYNHCSNCVSFLMSFLSFPDAIVQCIAIYCFFCLPSDPSAMHLSVHIPLTQPLLLNVKDIIIWPTIYSSHLHGYLMKTAREYTKCINRWLYSLPNVLMHFCWCCNFIGIS